ncbi:hypothetical protein D3C75_681990 [compost metagenome]
MLVEIGEVELRLGSRQQFFVLTQQRHILRCGVAFAEANETLHRRQVIAQLRHQRQEIVMYQDQAVLGMVHGVAHLLGGQPHVHRVQHRPQHRHGKEALQRPVAVPVEQGHGVARLDPGGGQHIGQPLNAFEQRGVGVAQLVGVDDFLVGLVAHARQQQALDQQRIGIGLLGRGHDARGNHVGGLHSCPASSRYRLSLPAFTLALSE